MVPVSTRSLSGDGFSFEEFDIDFEFDAPRFYDFTRAEHDSETEENVTWFESSGNYPPSPFSPKCNWKFDPIEEITNTSSESKPVEISKPVIEDSSDTGVNRNDKYNGFIYYNQTVKDVSKTKAKCKTKPSNSTLTRPTASLLARQNKPLDIYSVQLLSRCQRSLSKFGDNLSPILASKLQTQKLEAKVAQVNPIRRPKLTVPKEPNLRTAERSQRHRSMSSETEKNAMSRTNSSKKINTNKNINQQSTSTKSNTPRSQDLQAFRLRTSLRAKERSSNAKINAIQETDVSNSRMIKPIDSSKSRIVKENQNKKINSQVYESEICPLDSKRLSKEDLNVIYGNQSSCRADMKPFLDINRSLDLCRNFDTQEVAAGNLIIA